MFSFKFSFATHIASLVASRRNIFKNTHINQTAVNAGIVLPSPAEASTTAVMDMINGPQFSVSTVRASSSQHNAALRFVRTSVM